MSVYQSIFVSICIYMHIFAWISLYILCSFDKDNTKDRLQKTLLQISLFICANLYESTGKPGWLRGIYLEPIWRARSCTRGRELGHLKNFLLFFFSAATWRLLHDAANYVASAARPPSTPTRPLNTAPTPYSPSPPPPTPALTSSSSATPFSPTRSPPPVR